MLVHIRVISRWDEKGSLQVGELSVLPHMVILFISFVTHKHSFLRLVLY